jgi:hypothetical protein
LPFERNLQRYAAETFIHSDKPTELLGQYHTFLMDASVSYIYGLFVYFWVVV